MRHEAVVRSLERNRAINLKQRLPRLIVFFHEAKLHGFDSLLGRDQCRSKGRIERQLAASLPIYLVCGNSPGLLSRKRNDKLRLSLAQVGAPGAVVAIA